MSKAYKIDSDNRTVTEIFILGTGSERLQQLQQEVGGHIEVAAYLENNDAVYVNEEGMYCLPEDKGWFWFEGNYQPNIGDGLVVGTDSEGRDADPKSTLEEIKAKIKWMTRAEVKQMIAARDHYRTV